MTNANAPILQLELPGIKKVRSGKVREVYDLGNAFLLVASSLPFFLGLTVVMPVLGHATWHLYRKAVVSDAVPQAAYPADERARPQRYAADFPSSLFPTRR